MRLGEQDLINRAKDGDDRAFARLVSENQARVRAFLRRILNANDADDIAQEAFVTAWRQIDRLKEGVSFSSFVIGIAYRKAANATRSSARSRARENAWQDLQPQSLSPSPEIKLTLDVIMQTLPIDQAAAIYLCLGQDYSHSEAALILDIPLGTIKSNISRGRASLNAALGLNDHDA